MTAIGSSLVPSGNSVGLITDLSCDAGVFEGAFVYIESGVAKLAIASDISTSRVVGVVEFKSDTTTCDIRVGGISDEIFTGLLDNRNYFLSATTAGTATSTVTTGSGNVLVKLGKPITDKSMLVNIELRVIRV